jgi:hypothetical protein
VAAADEQAQKSSLVHEQMVIMLASENAIGESSEAEQIDMVQVAKRWLEKHPESCQLDIPVQREQKCDSLGRANRAGRTHEHGSEHCISAFLGREKWSRSNVHRLLEMAGLDDGVKESIRRQSTTADGHGSKPGRISFAAGPALAKLTKHAQRKIVSLIRGKTK